MHPPLHTRLSPALILLLAGLLCGFTLWLSPSWEKIDQHIDSNYPNIQNISVDQLRAAMLLGEPLYLIDVRENKEFAVSHLPGR